MRGLTTLDDNAPNAQLEEAEQGTMATAEEQGVEAAAQEDVKDEL